MRSFFPMSRGDLVYVVAVLAFAVVSFLPWSRDVEIGGLALLGWLMAALMIFSPVAALLRIAAEGSRNREREDA